MIIKVYYTVLSYTLNIKTPTAIVAGVF